MSPGKPRAAIVGAGPSGFYTASQLLAEGFAVDLFDMLPMPFGLVRVGVAPDHPKIKNVTRVYEKTAAHEDFRFFGDVTLGRDIVTAATCSPATTRSSTAPAQLPTTGSASTARTCPARTPPPSSSPGTTATRTTPTGSSTSRPSARS